MSPTFFIWLDISLQYVGKFLNMAYGNVGVLKSDYDFEPFFQPDCFPWWHRQIKNS